jgi:hypothetical protein
VLIEVDPDEHAQYADDVDLDAEAHGQLEQDEVDREGGIDAGREVRGEDALDGPLRSHDVENFSENSTQQASDHDKDEQH